MSETKVCFTGHRHLKNQDVVSTLQNTHAAPTPTAESLMAACMLELIAERHTAQERCGPDLDTPIVCCLCKKSEDCRLQGMEDLCKIFGEASPWFRAPYISLVGTQEEAPASSPTPMNLCTGASCGTCVQDDCDKAATLSKSHFEWEAHMDMLLAPVPPEVAPKSGFGWSDENPSPYDRAATLEQIASSKAACTVDTTGCAADCPVCWYEAEKLAAPQQDPPVPPEASEEEVTFSSYENKKPGSTAEAVEKQVTCVKMDRPVFPAKTIFPPGFPVPVMCTEFCETKAKCKLREQGIADLCKHNGKLSKLVHSHHVKVAVDRHEMWVKDPCSRLRTHRDNPTFLRYEGDRRIYAGDDTVIRESELECTAWPEASTGTAGTDRSGEGEVRMPGDKVAEGFVPAFIFGPGKPVWKAVTAFDSKNHPYTKLVKYQSIRPIACKVELKDGYVLPIGKASRVLKIKTRADRKRAQTWSAIKRELVPFVGIERAGEVASQQVAAMATC